MGLRITRRLVLCAERVLTFKKQTAIIPPIKDKGVLTQAEILCKCVFFYFIRKLCSNEIKNAPQECTLMQRRNMSLKRPAAGGESCKAGFFFISIISIVRSRKLWQSIPEKIFCG